VDEARAMAKDPMEKLGVADPEPQDKPTARDALGNKEPGFAAGEDESDEDPPLGK
jgi:hypothetical protein